MTSHLSPIEKAVYVSNLENTGVIAIMVGSCIAQIFPSRKFNALGHIIHASIHTDINIIYTHTRTHAHIYISL